MKSDISTGFQMAYKKTSFLRLFIEISQNDVRKALKFQKFQRKN